MASSNTLKNIILELFPDNSNKEISAADMRVFVNAVFDNKEEIVIKATNEADMKLKKDKIFEKSIVLITANGDNNGVYLSRVNNPISLLQLDKIADLANGEIIPGTPLSDFMTDYTHQKAYLDATYSYTNNNISNIKFSNNGTDIYDVNFSYSGNNISQTAIQEISTSTQILINYAYTNNNITSKTYVYV